MEIKFVIEEQYFDQEQKELIQKTLRLNDDQLSNALNKVGKAAFSEYMTMLIEGGMPNRADEAKQGRLLFLIQNYFENVLPSESQISTMFQLTQSQSKTLLKNTVSRYRHKLDNVLHKTMRNIINIAEHSGDKYLIVIDSDIVKDELNMLIIQNEPKFRPITKRKSSASQYEISEDSYELLCRELGLDE